MHTQRLSHWFKVKEISTAYIVMMEILVRQFGEEVVGSDGVFEAQGPIPRPLGEGDGFAGDDGELGRRGRNHITDRHGSKLVLGQSL
jgi:hypothetical protein